MFSTYQPLIVLPADGVLTDFAAPDLFYDVADLRCVVVIDGEEIPQVQGVDFDVIVIGRETMPPYRQEGLVRFIVPPVDGADVVPFILPAAIQDQQFEGRPVTPRQHERVHDRAVQTIAMLLELFNRSYRSTLDTPPALRTIVAGREGYVPTWDINGNLIEGPTVGQVDIVAEFIEEVVIVAGIQAQVVTVAGIAAHVVTVAGVAPQVAALGPVAGAIAILAPLDDELAALGPIAADIEALAIAAPNIATVAAVAAEVNTVAAIAADVETVAANIVDIQNAEENADAAIAAAAAALASENAVALAAIPVGMVTMQSGAVDPGHLRIGEGGTYDRGVYPDLAAWMDANGATAFGLTAPQIAAGELPEWRDYVPRTGGGALGPAVGVKQEDAIQNIVGEFNNAAIGANSRSGAFNTATNAVAGVQAGASHNFANLRFDASLAVRTATETRVKSFGVRWQIKAYGALVNQGTADLVAIEQAIQNGMIRKDVDQLAQAYSAPTKVNILKNTLQAWEEIGDTIEVVGSAVASVDFTGLSAYSALRITASIKPTVADSALSARVGIGGVYDSAANYLYQYIQGFGASAQAGGTSGTFVPLGSASGVVYFHDLEAIFMEFNKVRITRGHSHSSSVQQSGSQSILSYGFSHAVTAAQDSLRLLMSAGSIDVGSTITLEGLRG